MDVISEVMQMCLDSRTDGSGVVHAVVSCRCGVAAFHLVATMAVELGCKIGAG